MLDRSVAETYVESWGPAYHPVMVPRRTSWYGGICSWLNGTIAGLGRIANAADKLSSHNAIADDNRTSEYYIHTLT